MAAEAGDQHHEELALVIHEREATAVGRSPAGVPAPNQQHQADDEHEGDHHRRAVVVVGRE